MKVFQVKADLQSPNYFNHEGVLESSLFKKRENAVAFENFLHNVSKENDELAEYIKSFEGHTTKSLESLDKRDWNMFHRNDEGIRGDDREVEMYICEFEVEKVFIEDETKDAEQCLWDINA